MKDENCIFCKLANGDIPTATLYEDDDFRVILDAGPASKGHALILPKEHYKNLYELDDEIAAKALVLAKKDDHKAHGCAGLRWLQHRPEQRRGGRADGISFPHPPDPQVRGG